MSCLSVRCLVLVESTAQGVTSVIDGDTGLDLDLAPELDNGNVEFLRYPIEGLINGHDVVSKLSLWNDSGRSLSQSGTNDNGGIVM